MPPNTGRANGSLDDDDYVAQVLANEARDSSLKYSALGMGAYMPKSERKRGKLESECDSYGTSPLLYQTIQEKILIAVNPDQTIANRTGTEETTVKIDIALIGEGIEAARLRRTEIAPIDTGGGVIPTARMRIDTDLLEEVVGIVPIPGRAVDLRKMIDKRSLAVATIGNGGALGHLQGLGLDRLVRMIDANAEIASKVPQRGVLRPGYESDPLEDLVGPLPPQADNSTGAAPIRSRGRGAYRPNMSNIDAHFAPDYDPTLDVQLEDDDENASSKPSRRPVAGLMTGDDDWELALEAVRDRARWKQRGEDRLREAGFDDAFVKQWKSNTTPTTGDSEGRLEDVRWSKKGEGREWDRGKYVNEDGHIDVKAS
ncbi:hypothetical protein P875_00108885 [Aspergillus parasiticus SU-1]|uniref:Uncharacterized protein n=1 Tax=Aspergillus parasiticus (strain ATCC 56775 / NRRL 5862 / SRRC 143 / SU-1) TaxID=1403190 RepID=A0A0F0IJ76_ASPPU|nr:hypothetical protein P875_00108885 [Aspergillus parasiticus SU-1]